LVALSLVAFGHVVIVEREESGVASRIDDAARQVCVRSPRRPSAYATTACNTRDVRSRLDSPFTT
jgi:hypothetical protein